MDDFDPNTSIPALRARLERQQRLCGVLTEAQRAGIAPGLLSLSVLLEQAASAAWVGRESDAAALCHQVKQGVAALEDAQAGGLVLGHADMVRLASLPWVSEKVQGWIENDEEMDSLDAYLTAPSSWIVYGAVYLGGLEHQVVRALCAEFRMWSPDARQLRELERIERWLDGRGEPPEAWGLSEGLRAKASGDPYHVNLGDQALLYVNRVARLVAAGQAAARLVRPVREALEQLPRVDAVIRQHLTYPAMAQAARRCLREAE